MEGKRTLATECYLCPATLETAEQSYIVSDRRVPQNFPGGDKLVNQKVCENCAVPLRKVGFVVFNLAEARKRRKEKERQAALVTIGDLLKAKNGGEEVKLTVA